MMSNAELDSLAREMCSEMLRGPGVFNTCAPRRMISGVCATPTWGREMYDLGCAQFTLPMPVLSSHQWLRPTGQVLQIQRSSTALTFVARIADKFDWAESIWTALCAGDLRGVSIGATAEPSHRGAWQLEEITLTTHPANPQARVTRVWEQDGVVRLSAPSQRLFYAE